MLRRRSFKLFILTLLILSVGPHWGCVGNKGVRWAQSRAPAIRVNQLGYLPQGPKWATLRTDVQTPITVTLTQDARVLWTGTSQPRGFDEASGEYVHWIDFSAYQRPGEELQLKTDVVQSFIFPIRGDIFDRLPTDALKYFYHNRSGVEIAWPFVEQTLSRPAGHLSDARVECWLKDECEYALDVSGGWYDAGDHGKYVVNGGISAWTLLSLYERMQYLSHTAQQWGDKTLNIPESGNGIPDLLDEARYEVEFLLKMQVPAGYPLQGMVHHKIHDKSWTPLAIEPATETDQRALHPPSTAATLNMVAVAAQSARIFRAFDPQFAERCLISARSAFAAALKTPDKLAPELDKQGGGPYDDRWVDDEFFWAAAELYVTTNDDTYLRHVLDSPHYRSFPMTLLHSDGSSDGAGVTASMSWQSTAALGWISLALVPNSLSDAERERLRDGILAAADNALKRIAAEGYRLPMSTGKSHKYPWGSNSFVLNNMLILALAYDFSDRRSYADGVVQGMDYLLGRNPLLQSYVTGYGQVPLEHPHHRFWAHSLNREFPTPPAGAISGGPNSALQDPQTKKAGLSKALPPQKCFVDHIEAWSVNEVAINWNAPFAWCAVFVKEYAAHLLNSDQLSDGVERTREEQTTNK